MILVTGGHGTLGRRLVVTLETNVPQQNVFSCDLTHSGEPRYIRCDISEYRQVERMVDYLMLGPDDYVYHLAAEFGRLNGEAHYEECWRTNVIGTKHLIRLQERHRFKIIFASSSEIYGELPPNVSYEEGVTERAPLLHYNDYAMSKWVNEQQFRNSQTVHNTETMILRFFNAYGPGEYYHKYRSVVSLFIHAALHDQPLDVYEGYYRAFMYVDDLISTVANAWRYFKSGEVYNVGGREYRSVQSLADLILEVVGTSKSLIRLLSQREHNVVSKRPIIDKAVRDLGHNPIVTLDVGIPLTVDWMRSVERT